MQITDTIADLLTRIRNAGTAKHHSVLIPSSNMKKAIVKILYDEGYIDKFSILENKNNQDDIKVYLKYTNDMVSAISGIKRVSKPGLRIYTDVKDMPKVIRGLGIAIISTSKGVMTDRQARKLNVGGEVLAYVW